MESRADKAYDLHFSRKLPVMVMIPMMIDSRM